MNPELAHDIRNLLPSWPGDEPDINNPHDLAIRLRLAIQQERRRVMSRAWSANLPRLNALMRLRDQIKEL